MLCPSELPQNQAKCRVTPSFLCGSHSLTYYGGFRCQKQTLSTSPSAASSPAAGAMSSYFAHEHAAQVAADALAAASSWVDYGSNCETRNLIHRLLRKMQSRLHRLLLGLHVPEPRLWNSNLIQLSSNRAKWRFNHPSLLCSRFSFHRDVWWLLLIEIHKGTWCVHDPRTKTLPLQGGSKAFAS